jgi:hypothetical protein
MEGRGSVPMAMTAIFEKHSNLYQLSGTTICNCIMSPRVSAEKAPELVSKLFQRLQFENQMKHIVGPLYQAPRQFAFYR